MEQKVETKLNEEAQDIMFEEQEKMSEELMKEQFEADLKNKEDEILRGKKNLVDHEFVYDQQVEILRLLEAAYDTILENLIAVNPVWKYETTEEYVKLHKAQQKLKLDQELFQLKEQSIPSMEKTIAAKKEAIKSLEDGIAKMKGE